MSEARKEKHLVLPNASARDSSMAGVMGWRWNRHQGDELAESDMDTPIALGGINA